jgi:small-conductance mechanosensitive channel
MKRLLLALALVGCSNPDDCERIVKKLKSADMGPMGGDLKNRSTDEVVADCRKNLPKVKDDPTMKCVLDADGDDAVRACINLQLERMRAKEEKLRQKAEEAAQAAVAEAKAAQDKVAKLRADLDDLAKRVDQAVAEVGSANKKVDAAMTDRLANLHAERVTPTKQIAAAQAAAARAERTKGDQPRMPEEPAREGLRRRAIPDAGVAVSRWPNRVPGSRAATGVIRHLRDGHARCIYATAFEITKERGGIETRSRVEVERHS